MIKCQHCGYSNNNHFYCAGCGRKLSQQQEQTFTKLPEESTKFLEEVVNTIEKVFYPSEMIHTTLDIKNSINMSEISIGSGIIFINSSQWKKVDKNIKSYCFFGELSLSYILSLILLSIGIFSGLSNNIETSMKLFLTFYFLVSFLQWFIFPYLTGSTVVAFSSYKCSLFAENNAPVTGKATVLLTLYIFMIVYFFFPLFLIEYLLTLHIKSYTPAALKITGIDYLKNMGGA